MLWELLAYLAIGGVAGLLAGALGLGGGLVVVPSLVWVFEALNYPNAMHMAVATSLAVMLVTTFFSTRAHHLKEAVLWPVFKHLAPGVVLGSISGILISSFLSSNHLEIVFGLLVGMVAFRMIFAKPPHPEQQLPKPSRLKQIAFLVGLNSGIMGIGAGAFTTPYLVRCNVSLKNAIGTSSACSFLTALTCTSSFIFLALIGVDLVQGVDENIGYIFLPALVGISLMSAISAPTGAALAHQLPTKVLKRFFACFLLIVAIEMLLRGGILDYVAIPKF